MDKNKEKDIRKVKTSIKLKNYSLNCIIRVINNISIDKKNERIKNMNKLIDLISKKAADITINLSELTNILTREIKLSKLLLEEYKDNLIFVKE